MIAAHLYFNNKDINFKLSYKPNEWNVSFERNCGAASDGKPGETLKFQSHHFYKSQ